MKILFLGNCQVNVLRDFCTYYLNLPIDYLNVVKDLRFENAKANNLIINCDICVSQHFYSGKYYYNDDKISELLSKNAKIIYIHVLYYDGYFIDNEKKYQNLVSSIDIDYLQILKTPYLFHLISKNFSNDEIISILDQKFSTEEIIEGSKLSLQNLYERETGLNDKSPIDVKIYDYIKDNYKTVKLFHTLNHPCNLLLNQYSFKICEYIKSNHINDINLKLYNNDFDRSYERLGATSIPIYKKVYDVLQLEFDNNFIYHKYKKYDLNSYIIFIRGNTS